MIFLSNAEGVITAAIPEPINQGSVGVNRIVLIAPFPATAVVSATFTLPNGIKIYPRYVGEAPEYNRPYLMAAVEEFIDKGLEIDGVTVNAWQLTLDKAITSIAGKVTVQFLVTTALGTTETTDENGEEKTIGVIIPGTEQTLATTSATLPINRGNAYLAPSVSGDDINTIAEYLGAAEQAKINAKESENAAKTAATNAQTAQDYAETAADEAERAKQAAASSATAASDSATSASGSAESAASSATSAGNSATSAGNSATAASNSASEAKEAQEKAEAAANRASPWDLVITPQNVNDVLANWTQIEAASMLFFNIDFTQLVYGENPYIEFGNSTRKLEFRGCTFGDELGISLTYSGSQCSIEGAKGDGIKIIGFTDVIDCRANIIKDCKYVTACDANTLDDCIFVDPFTVNGFVSSTDTGKVPTLSQDGAYDPKPLPAVIDLAVDNEYKVTATLKDVNGGVISTAIIDLPLESVVVGATVSEDGKTLILKLQNEAETKIPLEDIFQGLATVDWVNAQISTVNTTINGISNDISNTNNRVSAVETRLTTAETDISTLKEDMSAAETEIEELKTSKLDSKGLTNSYNDNGVGALNFGAGGVVLYSDMSDGKITIGGYDGLNPIEIDAESIAGIPYDDIARKGKVEALETQNTILKKRVDNIEGAAIDFVVDSTEAVTKTVPTDALPYAKIMKIGGKTYLDDSPDGRFLKSAPVTELAVEGANLISFPYTVGGVGTVRETYGITWTVNADGSITANGTATGTSTFRLANANSFTLPKGNYILSGCPSDGSDSSYYLIAGVYNNGVYVTEALDIGKGRILNVTDRTYTGISIDLAVKTGTVCNNLTFYPMLNKGSTALPYRPYSKRTFPIPESVRPLNGINANACDYIAWEADGTRKKYECIAIVDANSLDWRNLNSYEFWAPLDIAFGGVNVLCSKYTTASSSDMPNETIWGGDGFVYIRDDMYVTPTEGSPSIDLEGFKSSLAGVQIAYEMKTPTVTDISDILTADNYIEVEGGGTITVDNFTGAPTTIYYATEKTGG